MQPALIDLDCIVTAAYKLCADGVRRWLDIDFAELMGFERPRNIRKIIESNREEMERHGTLLLEEATPVGGGPVMTKYWLTFEQCMVIAAPSRLPRAMDLRTSMIRVWSKFVRGEIAASPRMELRALESEAAQIVAPLFYEQQREFHEQVLRRMDHHDQRMANVERELHIVRKHLASKRREFGLRAKLTYIGTVEHHYNGNCPCCREVRIVRDGELLPAGNLDHWNAPHKNQAECGWPICSECNQQFERDPNYRVRKNPAFISFHEARRAYEIANCHRQGSLELLA